MPELPEVETVVRGIRPLLQGRTITAVHVRHKPSVSGSPKPLSFLKGRKVTAVYRRGKFIRIGLERSASMAVHLRMTGWLGVAKKIPDDAYLRVVFDLDNGEHLLFRDIRTFGRVWCGEETQIANLKALSKLGPEPLEIGADAFVERLQSRGGRLKALLLNQEFLAGVGNIYADEALYAARLHPLGKAARVKKDRALALHAAIQKILSESIRAGGSSVENFRNADGEEGWFQRELLAYGREGEPCRRCKTAIKRIVIGQRGTWFCPKCQRR
ncbi:MAG TPA: bifunctional DNA-formamidopyrimidine glycosylase/DNA-(apurinic or apyrimidinic site) lyase [Planctomycetota bacterium]|nr:bifunctional DNA-formamidopyrimidine glycosylase/DNA-(apurinic or apyrimidinic site) lyase [Planctomycetota bacterium]